MATSGFSYGKSAAEWNVFVIFVMAWSWFNATESKPQNVIGKAKSASDTIPIFLHEIALLE